MSSSDALWLKIWGMFAAIGFVLVIIGVIIEGVEHFKKFPRKEQARKLQIEKIGWFIVVVGLAMEFLGDNAAKRISDREAARLNKEAGDARVTAGNAEKEAGQANAFAARFNERAAMLESTNAQLVATNLLLANEVLTLAQQMQETANTANETRNLLGDSNTTARLNETKFTLAEASKVAADVRSIVINSNLSEIKLASPDRIITREQSEKFIKLLENIPRGSVVVYINGNSGGEVQNYAEQIREMIGSAGYDVGKMCAMGWGGGQIPKGVFIVVKNDNVQPPHAGVLYAGAIQKAMKEIGINAIGAEDPTQAEPLKIVVGSKP